MKKTNKKYNIKRRKINKKTKRLKKGGSTKQQQYVNCYNCKQNVEEKKAKQVNYGPGGYDGLWFCFPDCWNVLTNGQKKCCVCNEKLIPYHYTKKVHESECHLSCDIPEIPAPIPIPIPIPQPNLNPSQSSMLQAQAQLQSNPPGPEIIYNEPPEVPEPDYPIIPKPDYPGALKPPNVKNSIIEECYKCKKLLNRSECQIIMHSGPYDGMWFCKAHYDELVRDQLQCADCNEKLIPDTKFMRDIYGSVYHESCFLKTRREKNPLAIEFKGICPYCKILVTNNMERYLIDFLGQPKYVHRNCHEQSSV